MTEAQEKMLAAYRTRHPIEPIPTAYRDIVVCRHDGVRVVRIKNGTYRHDAGFVRLAPEK